MKITVLQQKRISSLQVTLSVSVETKREELSENQVYELVMRLLENSEPEIKEITCGQDNMPE